MKNIFNLIIAAFTLVAATACNTTIEDEFSVTVTIKAELAQEFSRAQNFGKGQQVNILYYNIFDASNDKLLTDLCGSTEVLADGSFKFSVEMLKGMQYDIALWAQNKDTKAYTLNGSVVTLNTDKVLSNDDRRDAFFKFIPNFDASNPASSNAFSLTRPFAQLNAATKNSDLTAIEAAGITKSSMTLNTYTKFDIAAGTVSGNMSSVTFAANTMPFLNNEEIHEDYKYLSMNYLFAPEEQQLLDVTFTLETDNAVVSTKQFHDIPLHRNFRTNIFGGLISDGEFMLNID